MRRLILIKCTSGCLSGYFSTLMLSACLLFFSPKLLFAASIRDIDFKQHFIKAEKLDETCKGYKEYFGEQSEVLRIIDIEYFDFDKDGSEEAVVEAMSCLMGTGGADIVGVYRMLPDGTLEEISISNGTLDREALYGEQGATPRLDIIDGTLVRWFTIHPKDWERKKLRSGWKRVITYQWRDGRFMFYKAEDFPPSVGKPLSTESTEEKTYLIKDEDTNNVSVLGVRRKDGLAQIKEKLKDKFGFEIRSTLVEGEEVIITSITESEPLVEISTTKNTDRVWQIWVASPRIATEKGIRIGAKLGDVIHSYGEPTEISRGEGNTVATYEGLYITFVLEYAGPELPPGEALWWKNALKYMDDIFVISLGIGGYH